MKRFFLLALLLLIGFSAFSQSLLWQVSGKKLKSPSYLYGTFHIQDQRVFSYDSTVIKAFNSCEAFSGELLLDEVDAAALRSLMYLPKGQTLSGMMSKEDFHILDSLCKANLGASAMFLNTMKPFFLASAFQQAGAAKDQEEALDLYFLKKAREQKKDCYGLETYEDQILAIDKISMEDQMEMLVDMLHDTTNKEADQFDTLIALYLAFDLDGVMKMTEDTSMPDNFTKVLVDNRNVTMAKGFEKIAKKQTLFCGVGAAHLAGPKGVIALLKKKGYTVEPVPFTWISKEE